VTMIRGGAIVGEGTIGELTANRARAVILRLADPGAAVDLPDCELVDRNGARVVLHHHGAITPLLAALATLEVEDVRIEEASLDQVFMEYYGAEAAS